MLILLINKQSRSLKQVCWVGVEQDLKTVFKLYFCHFLSFFIFLKLARIIIKTCLEEIQGSASKWFLDMFSVKFSESKAGLSTDLFVLTVRLLNRTYLSAIQRNPIQMEFQVCVRGEK